LLSIKKKREKSLTTKSRRRKRIGWGGQLLNDKTERKEDGGNVTDAFIR